VVAYKKREYSGVGDRNSSIENIVWDNIETAKGDSIA